MVIFILHIRLRLFQLFTTMMITILIGNSYRSEVD